MRIDLLALIPYLLTLIAVLTYLILSITITRFVRRYRELGCLLGRADADQASKVPCICIDGSGNNEVP